MRIDVEVLFNDVEGADQRILTALPEVSREVARHYLAAVQANVESGNVPGPPLADSTVEREARALQARGLPVGNANMPWRFMDVAIKQAEILSRLTGGGQAVAEIIPPHDSEEERPAGVYELLEYGGINEVGVAIPERALFRHTMNLELERMGRVAVQVLQRRLTRRG